MPHSATKTNEQNKTYNEARTQKAKNEETSLAESNKTRNLQKRAELGITEKQLATRSISKDNKSQIAAVS